MKNNKKVTKTSNKNKTKVTKTNNKSKTNSKKTNKKWYDVTKINKEKIVKFIKDNKQWLLILGTTIILIVLIIINIPYVTNQKAKELDLSGKDQKETTNDIEIIYKHGNEINITNFDKSFKVKKDIIINNKTKEYKSFSLEWTDIKNTLKNPSKLTYEIIGTGANAKSLSKSQIPFSSIEIFPKVLIVPNKEQTYQIIISYDKEDKETGSFTGKLKVKYVKENSSKDQKTNNKKDL